MLTMWIILRRLDHSRHVLIIMLCISAVCLNQELQQPNASIVPALLLWCSQEKKVASGPSDFISFLMAWKDFIEVQIECVPLRVVELGQMLSTRENALAGQPNSSPKLMFFIEAWQRHSNPKRCIKDDSGDATFTCTSTTRHTLVCFQPYWGQMRLFWPSNSMLLYFLYQKKTWIHQIMYPCFCRQDHICMKCN